MSIVIKTLSERVFDIVREQIVDGSLAVDSPIRQDALAAQLGVSTIPLREALARLEQVGLLTSHANRGFFVAPMSAFQAEEIYALRLAIEPTAAGYGALNADDKDRAAAMRAFEALDTAAGNDFPQVAVRMREFHVALVRPGGRLLTMQMVEGLLILSERYVIAHLRPAGRASRAHREHRELLDAFLAGQERHLKSALERQISATLEALRVQFAGG